MVNGFLLVFVCSFISDQLSFWVNFPFKVQIPSYIPVMFHNLSGYGSHLFIRELGAHTSDMEVIAKNKEDYISFPIKVPVDSYVDKNGEEKDKLIEVRFMDSFKFMSSSLDSLTKNLVRGGKRLFGFED